MDGWMYAGRNLDYMVFTRGVLVLVRGAEKEIQPAWAKRYGVLNFSRLPDLSCFASFLACLLACVGGLLKYHFDSVCVRDI